ncbi:MAG: DUF2442 domain-containing protein [Alteromonadaceae bacterium]|nr:DUF2442 domain-containing protein [Alteromonadaceae bacterium]
MLHVKNAKYINDFKLWVSFDDDTSGEVDLENKLSGPMFEPLKEQTFFSKVSVDPELETVVCSYTWLVFQYCYIFNNVRVVCFRYVRY